MSSDTVRITTVAGNVWRGRVINTLHGCVRIYTSGGLEYVVPRTRIALMESIGMEAS